MTTKIRHPGICTFMQRYLNVLHLVQPGHLLISGFWGPMLWPVMTMLWPCYDSFITSRVIGRTKEPPGCSWGGLGVYLGNLVVAQSLYNLIQDYFSILVLGMALLVCQWNISSDSLQYSYGEWGSEVWEGEGIGWSLLLSKRSLITDPPPKNCSGDSSPHCFLPPFLSSCLPSCLADISF